MKIDPRTGTIVPGKRERKPLIESPPRKKKQEAPVDEAQWMKIAKMIGEQIVEALKTQPAVEPVHLPFMYSPDDVKEDVNWSITTPPIEIDESVMDVGIEDIGEIKMGDGSATLAKKKVKSDKNLAKSKNKLAALKRGSK